MLLWKLTKFVEVNKWKKREENITSQHSSKKKKSNDEVTYHLLVEYHVTLYLNLNADSEGKYSQEYQTGQVTLYIGRSWALQNTIKLSTDKDLLDKVDSGETGLISNIGSMANKWTVKEILFK